MTMFRITRRQLVFHRDAFEVFAEMLDPILRLLVVAGRHAPYNSVSTAGRVEHAALRSVVDNGADVELVTHRNHPANASVDIAAPLAGKQSDIS